jgi:hypothetical protein
MRYGTQDRAPRKQARDVPFFSQRTALGMRNRCVQHHCHVADDVLPAFWRGCPTRAFGGMVRTQRPPGKAACANKKPAVSLP